MDESLKICPIPDSGLFKGLAKQNLLLHQALGELIDNSIAASNNDDQCIVHIFLRRKEHDLFDLLIADNSEGMDFPGLNEALQLGHPPTSNNRLNEHGFGLKNSLATLTSGERKWKIWSKKKNSDHFLSLEGPFSSEMYAQRNATPPDEFNDMDVSTIVYAEVSLQYLQTIQRGRGRRTTEINDLGHRIAEHLGVMYRGYLTPGSRTGAKLLLDLHIINPGNVELIEINPINIPYAKKIVERFALNIDGENVEFEYIHGILDEVDRDRAVKINSEEYPCKYYYQKKYGNTRH